jgi:hypothetical protein
MPPSVAAFMLPQAEKLTAEAESLFPELRRTALSLYAYSFPVM